ncbi:MAG: winged helix-turn-helix domain-containing protein [Gemmataceae bacterium]|nr:winged helix-turn-helix domain-containing protein [Gemmataceae bacterium]
MALVSHRPVRNTAARQLGLVREIGHRLPRRELKPFHVAIEINKEKYLSRDFTQRPRSFLFAAIAAIVARQLGKNRFRFFENGVTSLNLPVSAELIGARASRTTHPQTLKRFEKLFSILFDEPFQVQNPYLWITKAEVIGRIRTSGHSDLCRMTSSCVHVQMQTKEHPHCGRCSQCVDRRLNALAAGLSPEYDPADGYASDVILGERTGADLTYVERYTGFAVEWDAIRSPRELAARYPEVHSILPHLDVAPEIGLQQIHALLGRHALAIRGVLETLAIDRISRLVLQSYPAHSLMGVVLGRTALASRSGGSDTGNTVVPDRSARLNDFPSADGANCRIVWGDRTPCDLRNSIEYRLAERLLRSFGHYVSMKVLTADVWDDRRVELNTVQRTISNLRRRFRELGWSGIEIDGTTLRGSYRILVSPSESPATAG